MRLQRQQIYPLIIHSHDKFPPNRNASYGQQKYFRGSLVLALMHRVGALTTAASLTLCGIMNSHLPPSRLER